MKRKELSVLYKMVLIFGAILALLTFVIIKYGEIKEPIEVSFHDTYLCEKIQNEWVKAENVVVNQPIHICGRIGSNDPDLHKQVQVWVYKDKISGQWNAIYYHQLWVTNGDTVLTINTYPSPGTYIIVISSGKKTLTEITVQIIRD